MKPNLQLVALRQLAQLDVDAIQTYDSALAHVDTPAIAQKLAEFRLDHARHVQDLNTEIERLGGSPVRGQPDLKGLLLQGMTSVSGRLGTRGALMAMIGNEQLTTRTYAAALRLPWDEDLRLLIEKNHADELRHLRFMKEAAMHPAEVERHLEAESHAQV